MDAHPQPGGMVWGVGPGLPNVGLLTQHISQAGKGVHGSEVETPRLLEGEVPRFPRLGQKDMRCRWGGVLRIHRLLEGLLFEAAFGTKVRHSGVGPVETTSRIPGLVED